MLCDVINLSTRLIFQVQVSTSTFLAHSLYTDTLTLPFIDFNIEKVL